MASRNNRLRHYGTRRARPVRQSARPLPEGEVRGLIAAVVHEAVCEATGSDGFRRCAYYAQAGMTLLLALGYRAQAWVGGMRLMPDPADPTGWIEYYPEGSSMHAWVVLGYSGEATAPTVVDLSARHYRRLVEEAVDAEQPEVPVSRVWRQPEMDYLWCAATELPSWVRLRTDVGLTEELLAQGPGRAGWLAIRKALQCGL